MKRRQFIRAAAGSAVFATGFVVTGCSTKKEYDLLISGGTVYDGLGGEGIKADVAVLGDKIVKIAPAIRKTKAQVVIEADGMAVAPGFIDPHTHTDVQLLVNPKAESKIRQGVTTEIGGNCGGSYFPISDQSFEEISDNLRKEFELELTWRDMDGFIKRLAESGSALNYGTLLGQGSLREAVMGPYDRPPTAEELEHMKQLVREHMKAGVVGLSSGLEYTPGSFATTEELIELCREVSAAGGVYATHMRDEGDKLLEAIDEAVTIARQTGVSLEIAHFKAAYPQNWPKIDAMLSAVEQAKKEGIAVQADRYPYHAWSTGLNSYFPMWSREGTTEDFIKRLKDKSLQPKLKQYVNERETKIGSWEKVIICSVLLDKNKHLEGTNVQQAATEAKKPCYDFMRDLLIEEEGHVSMVTFGMSEDNLKRVLAHPLVTVGSDGNSVAPYGVLGKDKPHPRFYGTFPRVLGKFAREEKIFPLATAIKKMTSLSAAKFGLTGRGSIAAGNFADLVVFNPDTVIDKATFENPHQYPEGIPYVIVNGQVVISGGEHTGALPGRILLKTGNV
ncbi:D-aminoacylase [bacterium]|nr:D-aminoacylase [bacterium]